MTSQILGIGVGSFILVCIWIITFILYLIAIRTKKIIGFAALIIATLITLTLILIPKHSDITKSEQQDSDYNFIWHNLLATFFGLCSVGSIVLFVTEYAIEPIHTTQIRSWIIEK